MVMEFRVKVNEMGDFRVRLDEEVRGVEGI